MTGHGAATVNCRLLHDPVNRCRRKRTATGRRGRRADTLYVRGNENICPGSGDIPPSLALVLVAVNCRERDLTRLR